MNDFEHIFGPLISRRFGRSLGIDLCPFKTCSYDCIFCQLGRTNVKTAERREFFPFDTICDEIDKWLKSGGSTDYITLAGSGEPTLYSRFGEIIDFIHNRTNIPVLILSNGSLFSCPEVRKAASKADIVKLSMSAWNQNLFENINRPVPEITFEDMINGQISFRNEYNGKLILEVFLLAGVNAIQEDVEKIAEYVNRIHPDTIHLNTVLRPTAEDFAYAVDGKKLEQFSTAFTPHAEIPPEIPGSPVLKKNIDEEKILDLIRRRPSTLKQLAETFGAHPNEISKITGKLLRENKIITEKKQGKNYIKLISEQLSYDKK